MDIDRKKRQVNDVRQKICFCLDHLEGDGFAPGMDWNTRITKRLTLEEVIGAIVHAEQELGD